MVAGEAGHAQSPPAPERTFLPIAEIAVVSMALVVVGGIYLASQIPKSVTLWPAIGLLVVAAGLMVGNVVLLRGLQRFAWQLFFQVFRYTLLAYGVIAGMIGYVFIVDGTRGEVLAVLLAMLLVFAVDIPLLLAFSVARFGDVD
ncbi:MAG: hypothetical protein PVSMB7_27340 [Chloroflexota bacterium]